MECGLERVTLDTLLLLQEVVASGRADIAALITKSNPERERARRLSEYCNEIFAEIRVA
jgi:3-methyladenine DNA glycosylase AlkC